MGKTINRKKVEIVQSLSDKIKDASFFLFADYEGVSAQQITQLRDNIHPESKALVVKNKLAKLTFEKSGFELPEKVFKKATVVFFTSADPVKISKSIVDFTIDNESLKLKGGVLDQKYLEAKELVQLSKLPSSQELIGKLVMLIKSPINQMVMSISSPIRGLVFALKAIEKQKQEEN